MDRRKIGVAAAVFVAGMFASTSASAMLVLQGPQDFQGTGLGGVNTSYSEREAASDAYYLRSADVWRSVPS